LIGDPLETKHGASASQASSPARVKAKGGRPAEYDWHGFIIEIIRIADLDSLPERQSELMSRMLDWCNQTWGREPAESSAESSRQCETRCSDNPGIFSISLGETLTTHPDGAVLSRRGEKGPGGIHALQVLIIQGAHSVSSDPSCNCPPVSGDGRCGDC